MDIETHHAEFRKVIEKYRLTDKADKIAHQLVGKTVDVKKFAKEHDMEVKDAQVFLAFIQKGIDFKMRCLK